jgi:phosphate-selective porin
MGRTTVRLVRPSPALPAVLLSALTLASATSSASAEELTLPKVDVGFYVQPQLKSVENSVVANDEDGFGVRRFRLMFSAERPLACWKIALRSEIEVFPNFTAQDGYLQLSGPTTFGSLSFNLGQFKAPFSRQTLVSDSRLQLVEKAQITTLTPDRQVGFSATANLPYAEVSLGVFNGEGKNVVDNQDENFEYVGRLTLRAFGGDKPLKLMESAFQGTQLEVSGSIAHNRRFKDTGDQIVDSYGVDGYAAYEGASLAAEYVLVKTDFEAGAVSSTPFDANGFYVQAGYLLPLPGDLWRRFEVAARLEEVDRNDTVPIQQPGNAEQSQRYYTLGVSYYHWQHDLKVQLQASHIEEIEDRTAANQDANYDNDTVLLQVTYRQ